MSCSTLFLLASLALPLVAQTFADYEAQLHRVFNERTYDASETSGFEWLPDGSSYSLTRGSNQILVCAVESGQCTPKVNSSVSIESYSWSPDAKHVLVFTNSVRNWASDTPKYARKGDYWLIDVATGQSRKLAPEAAPSTLMFAKFSPDSRRIAYVRDSDMYVEDLSSRRTRRLTRDGSATLLNGRADWVYEEELALADAFQWSPDSRSIAFLQFDTSPEGLFPLINNTDTIYPKVTLYPYPKVGSRNAKLRLGILNATSGALRWTDATGDPDSSYLARFQWTSNTRLSVLKLNRLQNEMDLLVLDTASGKSRSVYKEKSDTWIDIISDPLWLDGSDSFLWLTEKDGWRRVLRINSTSGESTAMTPTGSDVATLLGVHAKTNSLYYLASPKSSAERYLFRTNLDGTGNPLQLSPATQTGVHEYNLSPGGDWATHRYSRFQLPPTTQMISLSGHRSTHVLAANQTLQSKVAPILEPALEYFTVEPEPGVQLDGWMMRPKNFNPARKYPLVLYVYGEPAGQTVMDQWGRGRAPHAMFFHRALADLGFLVASVDPRGTPALKGTEWRHQIYGYIGPTASKDFAGAVQALARQRPYIDSSRVGVWGRSGGGTSTLNLLFRYPDIFHAGASVAPVPDQRLYDTIYQERYMGLPATNTKGYAESAIHHAAGLRGHLLLIHGTGDDNVHIQGTELLINKLVELGKPFHTIAYPNRSHALTEGKGTPYHQFTSIGRFFFEHLKPAQ